MLCVGAQQRAIDRGGRRGRAILVELGGELRAARTTRGLSQLRVARASGVSQSSIQRIEAGTATGMSLLQMARVLAMVGLDLTAGAHPGGSSIRDVAHARLLGGLRALLPQGTSWSLEVLIGSHGDARAWDALITLRGMRIAVEAETRPRDLQELLRRLAIKRRDGHVDGLVLLLKDSRHNRELLREFGPLMRAQFPVPHHEAIEALRAGQPPRDDALMLL
jgi:transcriptional regulator with XRE-family HTH domain